MEMTLLVSQITINNLHKRDQIFNGGALGNFSLAGFEMVSIYQKWELN